MSIKKYEKEARETGLAHVPSKNPRIDLYIEYADGCMSFNVVDKVRHTNELTDPKDFESKMGSYT